MSAVVRAWFAGSVKPVAKLTAAAAAAVLLGSTIGPALGAPPADGAVTLTLPACAPSSPVGELLIPECSYVALPKKGGGAYYAYLSSGGDVQMSGSSTSGQLSLPPSGQNWPGLSVAGGLASVEVERTEIIGTVDDTGQVTLSVPYKATIEAGLFGSCTVTGTAALSSSASDPIGGAQGSPRDPSTNAFAAAGTSPPPVLQGSLCDNADDMLDLSRGTGWYVDGLLRTAPAAVREQTVSVGLPARIKRKGRTVLMTGPLVTNAGQTPSAKVTWGTSRAANGGKRSLARVTYGDDRVVIRTSGRAKKLFVRLTLRAPAVPGFMALNRSRVWVVR